MAAKNHVVDDGFVDEIANFDESRNSGDHPEDRHAEELKLRFFTPLMLILQ